MIPFQEDSWIHNLQGYKPGFQQAVHYIRRLTPTSIAFISEMLSIQEKVLHGVLMFSGVTSKVLKILITGFHTAISIQKGFTRIIPLKQLPILYHLKI
jgi:hypothetical protein